MKIGVRGLWSKRRHREGFFLRSWMKLHVHMCRESKWHPENQERAGNLYRVAETAIVSFIWYRKVSHTVISDVWWCGVGSPGNKLKIHFYDLQKGTCAFETKFSEAYVKVPVFLRRNFLKHVLRYLCSWDESLWSMCRTSVLLRVWLR